jgi:hypothetical protein
MADLTDVRRIVAELPETSTDEAGTSFSVMNRRQPKGLAWVWMERVDPKKPRKPNPEVLAIRVRDLEDKDRWLAFLPDACFTEPHYNGFPAVLVRLAAIAPNQLRDLLFEAWRCQAPAALVKRFDASTGR